jgi:hypothetical protein
MCNCSKRSVPAVKTQVQKQAPRSIGVKPNGNYGGVTPRVNTRRAIIRTK